MARAVDGFKVCSRKDCIHGGVKQLVSNFHKEKLKADGFKDACKDCIRGNKRKNLSNKAVNGLKICSQHRTCIHGETPQPVSNYKTSKSGADGLHSACNDCVRAYRLKNRERENATYRKWCKANPIKILNIRRRTMYGLEPGQWEAMYATQKGRCLCCGDRFSENRNFIHVHHLHGTGQVIGLLCQSCNLAEGHMKTPERAKRLWQMMEQDSLFYSTNNPDLVLAG